MTYLTMSLFTQRIVQDSFVFKKKERKTKRMSTPFVFGRRLGIYIKLLASQLEEYLFTTSIARPSKSENHPLTFSNCLFTQKTPTRKFKMPDFPSIDEVLDSAKNSSCSSKSSGKGNSKIPDFPSIDEVLDSAKDPLSSSSEPSTRVAFAMDSNTDPKLASNPLTEKKPSQHLSVPENSSTQQREDFSDDRSLFEEKSGEGK